MNAYGGFLLTIGLSRASRDNAARSMEAKEFQHLMRVADLERARAIAAAEQKYRDTIAALRRVMELSERKDTVLPPDASPIRHGEISLRVKRALAEMPETFSLRDVVKAVHKQDVSGGTINNKAISVSLKRQLGRQLELLEKGQGKRGSRYRKVAEAGRPTSLAG